jgi:hypothetical protein
MQIKAPDNEVVTRFVQHNRQIRSLDRTIKYTAFLDKRYPQEISVFCIYKLLSEQKNDDIWDISKYVYNDSSLAKARADIKVSEIRALDKNLDVIIDGKPVDIHANIKYPKLSRDVSKEIALELSKIAKHHIR